MPAGIGGMPRSLKRASERLSATSSRSPCSTWMSTAVWLSTRGREHLAAGRRDRRVAQDDLRRHAAHRLDAERQRRHVEQQHLAVAGDQDVGLHGGAERDDLVGVQLAVRRPAEQLADQPADERDARRAADQHDLVDLRRLEPGVGQRLAARRRACDRRSARSALRTRARVIGRFGAVVDDESRSRRARRDRIFAWMTALRISWTASARPASTPDAAEPPDRAEHALDQQQVDVVAAEVRVAVGRRAPGRRRPRRAGSRCRTCRRRSRRRR